MVGVVATQGKTGHALAEVKLPSPHNPKGLSPEAAGVLRALRLIGRDDTSVGHFTAIRNLFAV